jgi:hypothetical protein
LFRSWNFKVKIYRAQRGAGDRSGQHGIIACFTLTGGVIMSNSYAYFKDISWFYSLGWQMKIICSISPSLHCMGNTRSVDLPDKFPDQPWKKK